MHPTRRGLAALSVLLVTAIAVGPAAAQQPSQPQQPADADETSPTPGVPIPEDSELGVVHSWALAPAGAGGGSQSGDRANLTYEMAPGTTVQDRVTLFNFSNVPLTFHVFPTDASNNDSGEFSPVEETAPQEGVGAWVALPVDTISVPAGQAATFDIAVNVPNDARPGDHAGAILAANQATGTGPDGRIVNLDRQTGTRVYVRVAGELRPELAVEDLSTDYTPRLNPLDGTATVTYRIVNRGNVRLAGTQRVSIAGPLGLLSSSGPEHEIPELLPGASVEFIETIEGVAATVAAFAEVDIEPAAVEAVDTEIRADDRRAIGVAVPYLLVALLLAGALAWIARARYKKHRDEPVDDDRDDRLLEPQLT